MPESEREEMDKDFLDWYYSCQSDEEEAKARNAIARQSIAAKKYRLSHLEKFRAYSKARYELLKEEEKE